VRFGNHVRRVTFVAIALHLAAGMLTRAQGPALADVMRRAHEYAVTYQDHELSTVIARERYEQQWLDAKGQTKSERLLISDFLLFQLPPDESWFALRDVHEVDGKPIEDRAPRLNDLFSRPRDPTGVLGLEIAKESARFNLAPDLYYRTVNIPTFALHYLRPAHRSRMAFVKAGEEQIGHTACWIIDYRETKGPTVVETPDGDKLRAHGRFWVEPSTGAVMRSEMIVGGTRGQPSRLTVTVTYRNDASLGFRVPLDMQERYDNPRQSNRDVVIARATYTEFRRFDWRTLAPPSNGRE
jgi:hypothetical protein